MCLVQCLTLIEHPYLSGASLGMNLKMDTLKTYVEERVNDVLKIS